VLDEKVKVYDSDGTDKMLVKQLMLPDASLQAERLEVILILDM
jgi:hypothetical protein